MCRYVAFESLNKILVKILANKPMRSARRPQARCLAVKDCGDWRSDLQGKKSDGFSWGVYVASDILRHNPQVQGVMTFLFTSGMHLCHVRTSLSSLLF